MLPTMNAKPSRRGSARVDRRATIRLSRGLRVVVRTVEISTLGLSFRYQAPAEKGAVLEIELGLPSKQGINAVKLYGKVYHSHLYRDEYHTSVQFVNLSNKDRVAIERFIHLKELQRQASH